MPDLTWWESFGAVAFFYAAILIVGAIRDYEGNSRNKARRDEAIYVGTGGVVMLIIGLWLWS